MYRYFILVWNRREPQAAATAKALSDRLTSLSLGWVRAFAADGVCAFHAGLDEGASRTLLLDGGAGAIFGRIFNRDDDVARAARVDLDRAESLEILQSGGRRLFERYWGRYVALLHDAATGDACVLRDPSGTMPCLLAKHQGVQLAFSDLEDYCALGVQRLTVNWDYVRLLVAYSGHQSRDTALQEISEVQFGERVRFQGDRVQRSLEWNPFTIAQTDPLQDPQTAITELRRTTRACIHTWASCHTDIVHNLSGGLDSSIVLSCLKDAPSQPNLTCLHYFGTGPEEDERKYARLMANRARVELIEHQLDVSEARLEILLQLRRSSRPWFYMYEIEHGRFEGQLAAEREANALFSGAGGDGVFFQARAELAVTDYLFDHGPGRSLLRVAADAARVSRKSIWPLLLGALRARVAPRSWHPLRQGDRPERTLVSAELLREVADGSKLLHPWLVGQSTGQLPPGLLWHVMSVSAAPMYYNSFESGPYPERTLPLMSQPLVELCLRIPTYVLIKHGMDRATARRAFAEDLPPEIIKRRSKGRIDQHVRNILDRNLEFVRERLLNGHLVKAGLLDRKNLELYLTRERSPADFQYSEILQEYLCVEAWLGRWLDSPTGSADAAGLQNRPAHQLLRS